MYRRFNPEKLPELDNILEKYRGAESDLYQALVDKYVGPQEDDEESGDEGAPPPPQQQHGPPPAVAAHSQVIDMGELRLEADFE